MFCCRLSSFSTSSSSSVAGEARSLPYPCLGGNNPHEALAPNPAAALLSLAAPSHLRVPHHVDQGGHIHSALAQGFALHQLPTGREVHEVLQGDSVQGSDDEELVLLPLSINDDDDDDGSGSGGELQQAINATFKVAQQARQSGRVLGGCLAPYDV